MSEQSEGERRLGPLMLDLTGTAITTDELELISNPVVGGIILFARNYSNPAQLAELISAVRQQCPDLLIAVDQEGGRVQRLLDGYTRLPAMQTFLSCYRSEPDSTLVAVADVGWLLAAEVLAGGIDFSFAPVLDVDDNCCPVISERSFSPQPNEVAAIAGAFIDGMHDAGMAVTGKHFPGHGSVTVDSHFDLPSDNRTLAAISDHDLQPFQALADKLDAVMPGHIVFPKVDKNPACFSEYWLQTVLRDQLGFDGAIFSDDLSMSATVSYGDYTDRVDLALAAGCDMALICNNREGALAAVSHLQREGFSPSSRLAAMRKRHEWTWSDVKNNPRWLRAITFIESLTDDD